MKNNSARLSTSYSLFMLLLFAVHTNSYGQQKRMEKVQALYDSLRLYEIENPQTVLATAIVETGWMECKDCSLEMNNLFGFRLTKGYVQFRNISECLAYMKNWQAAFYRPWKAKHPHSSYYEFLNYVKYAANMPDYIKYVKNMERWVSHNLKSEEPEPDFSYAYRFH